MNCAFILSPSFSGSTLLSMLLAHHPKLTTLGEFLDSRERRHQTGKGNFCSCGADLEHCPYLIELARELTEQGLEFSINYPDLAFRSSHPLAGPLLKAYVRPIWFEQLRSAAILAIPAAQQELKRIVNRNGNVISTILRNANASVYLDSAKNNNRVLFFHRYAPDITVKTIWLKRDGRGVCNSYMKHFDIGMKAAIDSWSVANNSIINTIRHLPKTNVLVMHYEDLCRDPHAKLDEVCTFLDLDSSLMPREFSGEGLHLTGNNMRLNGLSEIRQDTKWKQTLSKADLELFAKMGGKLNRQLGYCD